MSFPKCISTDLDIYGLSVELMSPAATMQIPHLGTPYHISNSELGHKVWISRSSKQR